MTIEQGKSAPGPGCERALGMNVLNQFLQNCRQEDGVFLISEPRFFQHPEEAYDARFGFKQIDLQAYRNEGKVLLDLCEEFGFDASLPVLEIGCGTGRLSLALALSGHRGEILVTDPSPAFCRITAQKLSSLPPPVADTKIGLLVAEDLFKLPKNAFSLIVLRSVLHHILDIPRFFADCSKLLAPGGLMLFEEPCYEGFLMMGIMTQFMPDILKAQGVTLSDKHLADIQIFADTMKFYARRDVDKSTCEDKHLFRPDELMRISYECGMHLQLFPNRVFADIHHRNEPLDAKYFERFYYDYMKYALAWDQDLLDVFERYGKKYLDYFLQLMPAGAAPYTYGTFLCKKTAAPTGNGRSSGRELNPMALESEDLDFIKTKLKDVEGWCLDDGAYLTACLMQAQTSAGYDSGILEIGVYKGKYLSLLYQRARRTSQPVVGIDLFQWSQPEGVTSKFLHLFGSLEGLDLVTRDSRGLDASEVIGMLGGKRASFISVDGDHSAGAVLSDLKLSRAILSEGGIIAVDDFLNPKAIGVSEGFYRFMFGNGEQSLRPFAYCGNKLFCAELPYHEMYKRAIWALIKQMPNLSMVQEFNRQLLLGRGYVEQELVGSMTLIF